MKSGIPRAVLYARQSVGDEEQSKSVDEQLAQCRKLAEGKGWKVLSEVKDLNRSGVTYPAGSEAVAKLDREWQNYVKGNSHVRKHPYRDGLAKALKALRDADYLICYDATRLSRSLPNSYLSNYLTQAIAEAKAMLVTVHEGELDMSKFDTKLISTIREQVESDTKEKLRRRAKEGMRRRKDTGGVLGRTPFGYDKLATVDGRHRVTKLTIIPEEAEVVRWIFESYLEKTANSVAQELYGKGTRGKHGGTWELDDIMRVLSQPLYIGMQKDSEGRLVKAEGVEPIIPMELWNKAQAKRRKRRLGSGETRHQHYLRGIMFCACCGKKMQVHFRRYGALTYQEYVCHELFAQLPEKRKRGCAKAAIREHYGVSTPDKLQNIGIADSLMPFTQLAAWQAEKERRSFAQASARRAELDAEMQRLDAKEKSLAALWVSDDLTPEAYGEACKAVKEAKEAARKEIDGLPVGPTASRAEMEVERKILARSLKGQELCDLLHRAVKRIDVAENDYKVTLFDGSSLTLERVRITSARSCPAWDYKPGTKGKGGKRWDVVRYYYRSFYKEGDKSERLIYEGNHMRVYAVGSNASDKPKRKSR